MTTPVWWQFYDAHSMSTLCGTEVKELARTWKEDMEGDVLVIAYDKDLEPCDKDGLDDPSD